MTATVLSREVRSPDSGTQKVGLRIPRRLLLVSRMTGLLDGTKLQPTCTEILENALYSREEEADQRAMAYATGSIAKLGEPLEGLALVQGDELEGITVNMSTSAYEIAQKLGLMSGRSLSIQKVCEPLLCAGLAGKRAEAIEAAETLVENLKDRR